MRSFPVLLVAVGVACGGREPRPAAVATAAEPSPATTATASTPASPCDAVGTTTDTATDKLLEVLAPARRGPWRRAMADVLAASCRDTPWTQAMIDCVTAAGPLGGLPCLGELPPEAGAELGLQLTRPMKELMAGFDRAGVGIVEPTISRLTRRPQGAMGIPECAGFLQALDRYLQCPGLGESARSAAMEHVAAMEASLDALDQPYDADRQVCVDGEAAVRAGATAAKCAL
jgi:hypothetical protein